MRIANERAEAVVYYLTMADEWTEKTNACSLALADSLIWTSENFDERTSIWKGTGFDVQYKPWAVWDSMDANKPSKHPTIIKNSKLKSDFLDRSITITVDRDYNATKSRQ